MASADRTAQRDGIIDVVVIGSGFGGSMTALSLAREFARRDAHEKVLMLERGTWWTTPVGTVQDKEVKTYDFLKTHNQPVQFWSSVEHLKGFIDIVLRCVRRKGNEDGLYDLTNFGTKGFLGFGGKSDGVSILRASGVGGGSLVYANVTIQPPEFIFESERWKPINWSVERNRYYELARNAIGVGVLWALNDRDSKKMPPHPPVPQNAPKVNTGLSNIVTRSARLNPNWKTRTDPRTVRPIPYVDLDKAIKDPVTGQLPTNPATGKPYPDTNNALWIDRARVFQTAMSSMTEDFGTVDSSINDIDLEPRPFNYDPPKNYCERQGRCIIGCLPGARHTLNKQLMGAVFGTPQQPTPIFPDMSIEALCEVDYIAAREDGTYEVHYDQRDRDVPSESRRMKVVAKRVIVSAGCIGTNEIMLRSHREGRLPHLSPQVGFGFSTNGDYLAFVEETTEHISLTRGPVTTSFGHFNSDTSAKPGEPVDTAKFHTIEDNGIPRALSALTGLGVPVVRSIGNGRTKEPRLLVLWALLLWLIKRFIHYVRAFFINYRERQDVFESEDEMTAKMMCIAAMGREASIGKFTLGKGNNETPLRVQRTDKKPFHLDPIYDDIKRTLDRLAVKLTGNPKATFINPFLSDSADALAAKSITLSHPLGGCIIAADPDHGTVDEFGRVFNVSKRGSFRPFYEGLYIADASIIPSALGVNPSLTISALSLRVADKIIEELEPSTAGMVIREPGIVKPGTHTTDSTDKVSDSTEPLPT
jgi:choline dehydrogenase-like flavoprotein